MNKKCGLCRHDQVFRTSSGTLLEICSACRHERSILFSLTVPWAIEPEMVYYWMKYSMGGIHRVGENPEYLWTHV